MKKTTSVMTLRNVPVATRLAFKVECIGLGTSMQAAIAILMQAVVDGKVDLAALMRPARPFVHSEKGGTP